MSGSGSASGEPLFQDFFSTIEEAGLGDIAAEVGLGLGGGGTLMGSAGGDGDLTGVGGADEAGYSGANGDDDGSPLRVSMPQYATAGPSVPSGLADALGASGGEPASKKKRMQRAHGGKAGDKGLRHFSMKVCEKVEQKARTTYNEVADELVAEFAVAATEMVSAVDQAYDEKNIRRRVYDALNVLMAMDIITKEKKSILWRGLPTNTEQEGARLQMDLNSRTERMDRKRQHLQDLVSQQVSFKQLIARNRTPAGASAAPPECRIALPFIVVNTRKETVIDCEMAEDRQEIFFNFSAPFEIHDDSETLKRMNMQQCPPERIAELVPEGLSSFALEVVQSSADGADTAGALPGRSNGARK